MEKTEKIFKISVIKNNSSKERIESGTLNQLINVFKNELEAGNKINPKVKVEPKDINQFVNNLQKAYKMVEANTFAKTFIDLVK